MSDAAFHQTDLHVARAIRGENAASALVRALVAFAQTEEGGFVQAIADRALLFYSGGSSHPMMNGIAVESREIPTAAVAAAAVRLDATGRPWTLQHLGAVRSPASNIPVRFHTIPEMAPAMSLDLHVRATAPSSRLVVTHVRSPSDVAAFATAAANAAGHPSPVSDPERYLGARWLHVGGVSGHVAFVDGEPAGTGRMIVDERGWAGIFAVSTVPRFRRRGIARAMMEHLLWSARAAGAHSAVLQTSEMARSLYEDLGFRYTAGISYYPLTADEQANDARRAA